MLFIGCQSALWSSTLYYTNGILGLANNEAGCELLDDDETCENLVHGIMKPTSLATLVAAINLAGTSLCLPFLGGLVDKHEHAGLFGLYNTLFLAFCTLLSSTIHSRNGWILLFYILISTIMYTSMALNVVIANSFIHSFGKEPDDLFALAAFNIKVRVPLFILTIFFISVVSLSAGLDDIETAQIAQALSFLGILASIYIWWVFMSNKKIGCAGDTSISSFKDIYNTIMSLDRTLKFYLSHAAFAGAAIISVISTSTIFMSESLNMSSGEIGMAMLLFALFAIPGSKVSQILSSRTDPLISLQLNLMLWVLTFPIASAVLDGRDFFQFSYIFCAFWGTLFGWYHVNNFSVIVLLIPEERSGGSNIVMGVYIFSITVLSWLPTLIFTILNEADIDMRLGLVTFDCFYIIAFLILKYLVGDFSEAMRFVHRENPNEVDVQQSDEESIQQADVRSVQQSDELSIQQSNKVIMQQSDVVNNACIGA